MSNLRILGIIIGIVGLLLSFRIFRGPRWNRFNFLFFALFSLVLMAVSIDPNLVNIVRGMMALEHAERGRLIALLISSNIVLWFLIFYLKNSLDSQRFQFDRLVRALGEEKFQGAIKNHQFKEVKIAILIPAYNESENLRELLPKIPDKINGERLGVLVVDDGSDDATSSTASQAGVCVVKNLINRGGGAALRLGYDILKRSGVEICVTMDADGQHRPEEIVKLVSPIIRNQYDLVIGSRILGHREKDSLFRLIGIYSFSFIINALLGIKITDPSSGFRAFRMDTVRSIHLNEDQYHTSELIINATKNRVRMGEVPITIMKRKYGKSKKGVDWKYGLRFAKIVITTWWR